MLEVASKMPAGVTHDRPGYPRNFVKGGLTSSIMGLIGAPCVGDP